MGRDRLTVFDTTLRDGEQAPGFSMRIHEKVRLARQLDALGVDVIEAGFPIASEADAEAVRAVAAAVRRPVIAGLARACAGDIDKAGVGPPGGGAVAHPHLHRHVRPASRAQAEHDARGVPGRRDRRRGPGAPLHRRRAVLGGGRDAQRRRTSCAASSRPSSPPARRPSTCPTRSATRRPTRSRSSSPASSAACPTPTRRCSAPTATTTSASPWRTRSPPSARACARWSARSTASASAPATPRSKRW